MCVQSEVPIEAMDGFNVADEVDEYTEQVATAMMLKLNRGHAAGAAVQRGAPDIAVAAQQLVPNTAAAAIEQADVDAWLMQDDMRAIMQRQYEALASAEAEGQRRIAEHEQVVAEWKAQHPEEESDNDDNDDDASQPVDEEDALQPDEDDDGDALVLQPDDDEDLQPNDDGLHPDDQDLLPGDDDGSQRDDGDDDDGGGDHLQPGLAALDAQSDGDSSESSAVNDAVRSDEDAAQSDGSSDADTMSQPPPAAFAPLPSSADLKRKQAPAAHSNISSKAARKHNAGSVVTSTGRQNQSTELQRLGVAVMRPRLWELTAAQPQRTSVMRYWLQKVDS